MGDPMVFWVCFVVKRERERSLMTNKGERWVVVQLVCNIYHLQNKNHK